MSTTQRRTADQISVTFADPSKPSFTVRFKTTNGKKRLQGIALDNIKHEIIVNDINHVNHGDDVLLDPLSLRISFSGAVQSRARLEQIAVAISGQLNGWFSENVLLGFEPVTPPVNPENGSE